MNYITKDSTIIFDSEFNQELNLELITKYQRLIFSDYILNNKLFNAYENNTFDRLRYCGSIFNHPIDALPSSIIYLTIGHRFNHPVNHLPSSLIYLTFGNCFNHPVNTLSSSGSSITHLTFGYGFNQDRKSTRLNSSH